MKIYQNIVATCQLKFITCILI